MEPNDGLAGVSDDELEGAVNSLLGPESGPGRSRTPRRADPAAQQHQQEEPAADQSEATLLQQLGYETPETAVKSVRLLRNDRSKQETEKNEWRDRALAAEARLTNGEFGRVSPNAAIAQRGETGAPDVGKVLTDEFHVPSDLVEKLIDQRMEAGFKNFLQPIMEMTQADQRMVGRYGPEYARVKPQIDRFVAATPQVAEIVNLARQKGQFDLANEYALGAYREAVTAAAHGDLTDESARLGSQVGAQRGAAGPLPQSRENTRKMLAARQAGGAEGIDPIEAINRANQRGDYSLIDQAFASQLPSEERMLQVMRGW